jgi:hypothetical protein
MLPILQRPLPIVLALITALGGTLAFVPKTLVPGPCVFFTRNDLIVHLWLFSSTAPYDQLEVGLALRAQTPSAHFRILPLDPLSTGPAPWQTEHGGYARASNSAQGLWMADSGTVSLRFADSNHVSGHYALALSSVLDAKSEPPHLRVEGDFDAPRDTVWERYLYRPRAKGSMPQHLCSRRAPA